MPDQELPSPGGELTPAQETQVRRLLAEARHDEPMPAEVAARLDRVLAGLAAGGSEVAAAEPAPDVRPDVRVVSLDDVRRRRRRAGSLLVAAAAAAIVGVGVPQLLGGSGSGDAASSGDMPAATAERDNGAAVGGDSAGAPASRRPQPEVDSAQADTALPLTPGALRSQLATGLSDGELNYDLRIAEPQPASGDGCVPTLPRRARTTPVVYDGRPGVVVIRPRGTRELTLQVFVCGEPTPVRTVTLPLP